MTSFATSVRTSLYSQAVLTLLFGFLGTASAGGAWTAFTVLLAAAAAGLGAALKPTATMRSVVIGFEGVAALFGVVGLAGGHYVPGTIIGLLLLVRVLSTPAAHFVGAPVAPVPMPPAGYAQPGYPQSGYPQSGYPQAGYPQAAYPPPGYPAPGAAWPPAPAGYPQPGYPQAGYPQAYPQGAAWTPPPSGPAQPEAGWGAPPAPGPYGSATGPDGMTPPPL